MRDGRLGSLRQPLEDDRDDHDDGRGSENVDSSTLVSVHFGFRALVLPFASLRCQPICGLRHGQTGDSAGVKSWTAVRLFCNVHFGSLITLAPRSDGCGAIAFAGDWRRTLNPPPTP